MTDFGDFTDYDEYINSEWKKSTDIPAEYGRWNNFYILNDENMERIRSIAEESIGSKVNLLYHAFMQHVDKPIDLIPLDYFMKISIQNADDFWSYTSLLFRAGISGPYHISKEADCKDSSRYVPTLRPSGLGMGDRSYYLDRDNLETPYKELITKLFSYYSTISTVTVNELYSFEKELAKLHMTRAEMREVDKMYNPCKWSDYTYLRLLYDDRKEDTLIVTDPAYLHKVNTLVQATSMHALTAYVQLRILLKLLPYQNDTIAKILFDFFGKKLGGRKEIQPRWKRAVRAVTELLRDDLSKLYIEKYFTLDKQQACNTMISYLRASVHETLGSLSWMTPETRQKALDKFNVFTSNIGFPKKYLDTSGLIWTSNMGISELVTAWGWWDYNFCEKALFYTPIDRDYWSMGAFEVNAYCDQNLNGVYFPAGILQKPFFGHSTIEENLGSIGVIIGHEITHGFDDQGRKYDYLGQLSEWWTEEDVSNYTSASKAVLDHYNTLETNGKKLNGQLTLGENIADIGGVQLAYRALEMYHNDNNSNFSNESRKLFFESYARLWREVARPDALDHQLTMDCHAPAHWRINGVLSHIDGFYQTYNITDDNPMYLSSEQRTRLWS